MNPFNVSRNRRFFYCSVSCLPLYVSLRFVGWPLTHLTQDKYHYYLLSDRTPHHYGIHR